jgi:hypothetical protein
LGRGPAVGGHENWTGRRSRIRDGSRLCREASLGRRGVWLGVVGARSAAGGGVTPAAEVVLACGLVSGVGVSVEVGAAVDVEASAAGYRRSRARSARRCWGRFPAPRFPLHSAEPCGGIGRGRPNQIIVNGVSKGDLAEDRAT